MQGAEKNANDTLTLSRFVLISTVVYLVLVFANSIWYGMSLNPPPIVKVFDFVAFVFAYVFVLLNLLLAVSAKGFRKLHLLLLGILIAIGLLCSRIIAWHVEKRHQWFLHEGIGTYEQKAQMVLQRKEMLTADSKQIPTPSGLVSAYTNADGSVTIWFPGHTGSGMRHGYIYHSGAHLSTKPGNNSGDYFYHLTNAWYEY